MQVLIKNATIVCSTSKFHLQVKDIFIKNGVIEKIAKSISLEKTIATKTKIIDVPNTFVSTGWVDVFSNFADPGYEHKETISTGTAAAVAGGFTDVFLVPNTYPCIDNKTQVQYVQNQLPNSIVNIYPIGAISKNLEGKELAEMIDMQQSGAIAFSDGTSTVQSAGLMQKALEYVKAMDGVVVQIPNDKSLSAGALMNEGINSTQLGMQGAPAIAEEIMVQRDIELAKYTNSRLHLTGISTAKSVELIRKAKKEKINITCSCTPYHLFFTDDALKTYNSMYKVVPPLRTLPDTKALLKGLHDGTIDCITTHHNPQDWDAKNTEFAYAKSGMIGLQTMLHYVLSLQIEPSEFVPLLTQNARTIFKMAQPQIAENQEACLTIFSTSQTTEYTTLTNKSTSQNSPFINTVLKGKILAIFNHQKNKIYE